MVYPPSAASTSNAHLTGTTAGMIVTAVVAISGIAVLLGMVFLADGLPFTRRAKRGETGGGGQAGEIPDGQGDRPWEQISDRHLPAAGYSHGRPASWVLVAVVLAAALTGGISIITHSWWLLWACIAIAVLAIPAGKMIGIMDDSVDWGSTPAATTESQPPAPEADHGRDQPAHIR
jgi:hypothetical protein